MQNNFLLWNMKKLRHRKGSDHLRPFRDLSPEPGSLVSQLPGQYSPRCNHFEQQEGFSSPSHLLPHQPASQPPPSAYSDRQQPGQKVSGIQTLPCSILCMKPQVQTKHIPYDSPYNASRHLPHTPAPPQPRQVHSVLSQTPSPYNPISSSFVPQQMAGSH